MEPKEPAKICPTCGQSIQPVATPEGESVTLTAPEGTIGAIGAALEDEGEGTEKETSGSGPVA
jgi:hypothetical protein